MKQAAVLYEPTPIARLGVRADSEVVIGIDFSCFAYMLQEYISYGIVSILIPSSLPEALAVDEMPAILRERVRIVDDRREIETIGRLLLPVRRVFEVGFVEDSGKLIFAKAVPPDLRLHIDEVRQNLKRLAFGFNHGVKVEIHPKSFLDHLYSLRQCISDTTVRSVLSAIEGILRQYDTVVFDAQVPNEQTPSSLISLFDNLVNNPVYVEYCETVDGLAAPSTRMRSVARLRELGRVAKSRQSLAAAWDYSTKLLKVWSGLPIPESKELGSLFSSRTLPPLVDMATAHQRAVEAWRVFGAGNEPLRRERLSPEVHWFPPLPSMRLDGSHTMLGTAGELKEMLEQFQLISRT